MDYYCPKCGQKVLYSDSSCKYCHTNLVERICSKKFGFSNVLGLSISMILTYVISLILELVSYGIIKYYAFTHGVSVEFDTLTIGIIIALSASFVAFAGNFVSEDSTKFIGILVLGMATSLLLESIYALKTTGELIYIYNFFVVAFQIVTSIFMLSSKYDATKKVLLAIMAILFLISAINSSLSLKSNDSYPHGLNSAHVLSILHDTIFIVYSLLLTIFTFVCFRHRKEYSLKVLATTKCPNKKQIVSEQPKTISSFNSDDL